VTATGSALVSTTPVHRGPVSGIGVLDAAAALFGSHSLEFRQLVHWANYPNASVGSGRQVQACATDGTQCASQARAGPSAALTVVRQIPPARYPPSTLMTTPVTNSAAGEARKTAAPISSSTLPNRPAGVGRNALSPEHPHHAARAPEPSIRDPRTACLRAHRRIHAWMSCAPVVARKTGHHLGVQSKTGEKRSRSERITPLSTGRLLPCLIMMSKGEIIGTATAAASAPAIVAGVSDSTRTNRTR
jgi:hypothetical protein